MAEEDVDSASCFSNFEFCASFSAAAMSPADELFDNGKIRAISPRTPPLPAERNRGRDRDRRSCSSPSLLLPHSFSQGFTAGGFCVIDDTKFMVDEKVSMCPTATTSSAKPPRPNRKWRLNNILSPRGGGGQKEDHSARVSKCQHENQESKWSFKNFLSPRAGLRASVRVPIEEYSHWDPVSCKPKVCDIEDVGNKKKNKKFLKGRDTPFVFA